MLVLDASVGVALILNQEPYSNIIRSRIKQSPKLYVPHLFEIEVIHVLRRLNMQNEISDEQVNTALYILKNLRLKHYHDYFFLNRIWELRSSVSAYDAAYVALAEALGARLLTLDLRLARAHGHSAKIDLLRPS